MYKCELSSSTSHRHEYPAESGRDIILNAVFREVLMKLEGRVASCPSQVSVFRMRELSAVFNNYFRVRINNLA